MKGMYDGISKKIVKRSFCCLLVIEWNEKKEYGKLCKSIFVQAFLAEFLNNKNKREK